MKSIKFFGVAAALVAAIVFTMSACASMTIVDLDYDSVKGPAQVRQFGAIDPKDITIFAFYKDDSRKQISINPRDITFDSSITGSQTVRVKVASYEASFQTQVMALNGITISSPPTKTLFKIGESADAAWPGLDIQGSWEQLGSSKIDTASCQFAGYSSEPVGRKTITVTYGGKTATFNVEVLGLASIELEKPPTKTDYNVGEALDLAGISLYGNYGATASNRIRELIPPNQLTASGYDANRTGQQRITVTVMGQSATFTVNVLTSLSTDYIITQTSVTAYSVTRRGESVGTGTLANVLTAIRTHAAGADIVIRFGAEGATTALDIGYASANFNNTGGTWGAITLTGKIVSQNSINSQGTILINDNVSVTSTADIANLYPDNGGMTVYFNSTGTLTISGGTITATTTRAVYNRTTGTVNITGGTISATTGTAVYNYSRGAVNISGGTISVTTGFAVSNYYDGVITISGTPIITSANTSTNAGTILIGMLGIESNKTVLVLPANWQTLINNTAGGKKVHPIPPNAVIEVKQ